MTGRTQVRDVRREGGGLQVLLPQDPVPAMAVRAHRGVAVPLAVQGAMFALLVLLNLRGVANGAVDLVLDRLTGPGARRVDLRVALSAGYFDMHGVLELFRIHEQAPAVRRGFDVALPMAQQTVQVGHPLFVKYIADLVRLMAVYTDRDALGLLLP